ncbi:serine--tRNA ligase [Candidatus Woesearchaeota archaeon CG10_big_fil_rev_8_21_14_0_10_44_13]|nr:MAG: serine--tRNA ligase [Candidatus Woesearchaeota archaeon CG10_big_fil_rev_8_21_14_0_10_44_13]
MLDINLIRTNPKAVENDLKKRGDSEKLRWLKELIDLDAKWRQLKFDVQNIVHNKNEITKEIAKLKKEGKDVSKQLKQLKDLPEKATVYEAEMTVLKNKIDNYLMRLPNILHDSVPVGKDDSENGIVREWGKKPEFDFAARSHVDLLESLDVGDIERAAKVSGARFYYLKNELVMLDLALQQFAIDALRGKGFVPVFPPFLMKKKPYEGVTSLDDFEDVLYKIEGEDLYLIATSEHPLTAMHMDETIGPEKLPIRYAGLSTCFRKEAGAHGKDTKGIFRVHQFNKIEQIIFCEPKDSWKFHEELIKNAEEIFQKLGLPYRIVNICTGDIGTVAAKKYDLEVWMPVQNCYREAVSCSNCTDYQARRLNIKSGKEGGKKELVHTLNSTAIATGRCIVAILENFQNKDGSVNIPKILQPYMGNMKRIEPKKG